MDNETESAIGIKFAEYFQSPLLDDIYEARTDGLFGTLLKDFRNEIGQTDDIKEEMRNIIMQISDKKIQNQLLEKLQILSESYQNEEGYLISEYYKFGLTDNLQLSLEIGYRSSILKRIQEKVMIVKIKFQMLLKNYDLKKVLKKYWKNTKK